MSVSVSSVDRARVPHAEQAAARRSRFIERVLLWLLIAILAWAQFPLGSNRLWSCSLLVLLIALLWVLWIPLALEDTDRLRHSARPIAVPALLLALPLLWAWLQATGWTPASWRHPAWSLVDGYLGPVRGAVSVDPHASLTEVMKLAAYIAAGWLAYYLAARHENARKLFAAIFAIGVIYAIYGIVLSALQTSQITLLEGAPPLYQHDVTGGFVYKNAFATFTGLALLCAFCLIFDIGRHQVIIGRGWRPFFRTTINFGCGKGALPIAGMLVLWGALVASDSRAGLSATLLGSLTMFAMAAAASPSTKSRSWSITAGITAGTMFSVLFYLTGHTMQARIDNLIETGGATELRPELWASAIAAIRERPWLGSGLGSFQSIYGMHSHTFVPFVVDHAHNDFLDFAACVGIPAAAVWISGICFLALLCARAVFRRRRRRMYSLAAIGATVLVAFHSIFDFTLQMPAVSLLYAIVLGIGIGQSAETHRPAGLEPNPARFFGAPPTKSDIKL